MRNVDEQRLIDIETQLAHQERLLALQTPDPALDSAFRWAQIAIERAWVRVDGLGRGLVAGLGLGLVIPPPRRAAPPPGAASTARAAPRRG